ncbi:prolyl oligopeptidase family serine peptidase [Flavobacterium sp. ASW18X]|uniref:prolyl oligopeptidase family serine peptidase n=1 Tax=Flavobacterium sp. ASW18X TaxID=2572595 RepID=UPI00146C6535|nr:prolyl oligopeptidase family serine peptidase [Flavobacterium sp. ASW18X]
MRYFLFPLISLILLSCQKETKRQVYNYRLFTDDSINVSSKGLKYVNHYTGFETFESTQLNEFTKYQDSLVKNYFDKPSYKAFEENINNLTKSNFVSYGKHRPLNDSIAFVTISKDSTTFLAKYNYKTNDVINKIEFPELEGASEININYAGKALSFYNETDEGHKLFVYSYPKKELLFSTNEGVNPYFYLSSTWFGENSIAYIAFPYQDNATDSYIASVNLENKQISKIFSHKDYPNANNENWLIPITSSSSSPILQAYVANAGDIYESFYINREEFTKPNPKWNRLAAIHDSTTYFGDERNGKFIYRTYINNKLVVQQADITENGLTNKETLFVPETDSNIGEIAVTKEDIYVVVNEDGIDSKLYKITNNGNELVDIDYPTVNIEVYNSFADIDNLVFYTTDWGKGTAFYNVNGKGVHTNLLTDPYPKEYDNITYEVISAKSHDNKEVPVTIVNRKDFKLNPDLKTIVYAYGAYGINATPLNKDAIQKFILDGNQFIIAHVRGGAEKGQQWYFDGILDKKENSWKDVLSTVKHLRDSNLVNKERVGLLFGSAGGISCGMALNEKPEWFSAAAGLSAGMNPLRLTNHENYSQSDQIYDFGDVETEEGVSALYKMDPVIHFNSLKEYPPTLLMVGEKDDLVPNSASAKYIAHLQTSNSKTTNPYLYLKYKDEGHYLPNDAFIKAIFFLESEL